jgi:hypothetical protein
LSKKALVPFKIRFAGFSIPGWERVENSIKLNFPTIWGSGITISNGEDSPCLRVPMEENAEWLPTITLFVVSDKIVVTRIFVWGSKEVLLTSPITWKFPESSMKVDVLTIWIISESRFWANPKLTANEVSDPVKVKIKMKESNAIKVVCKNRLLVIFELNKLIINYLRRTFIKIIC